MKNPTERLTIRLTNFLCQEMAQDKTFTKSVVLAATIKALEAIKIKGVKSDNQ